MRGNRRQKRPEDLQGRGSRHRGQKTVILEWTPEQAAARQRAIEMAIAQVERQCSSLARSFGAGDKEPVSPAKSEVASLKPRDERGRFVKVQGEKMVASEWKPRKKRQLVAAPPVAERPKCGRLRKSEASIIRAQLREAGLWPVGR